MIEFMKFDMGGSASTLGAAAAIAQLKPKDYHFMWSQKKLPPTCEMRLWNRDESWISGNISLPPLIAGC